MVDDDEVGDLPREGWGLTAFGLASVEVCRMGRRTPVRLPPVPGHDRGQLGGLLRKGLEPALRPTADDETDQIWHRCLPRPSFLNGLL